MYSALKAPDLRQLLIFLALKGLSLKVLTLYLESSRRLLLSVESSSHRSTITGEESIFN
jgi:hypothetical protein